LVEETLSVVKEGFLITDQASRNQRGFDYGNNPEEAHGKKKRENPERQRVWHSQGHKAGMTSKSLGSHETQDKKRITAPKLKRGWKIGEAPGRT